MNQSKLIFGEVDSLVGTCPIYFRAVHHSFFSMLLLPEQI